MRFGWLTLAHSGSPDADYGAIQDLVTQASFAETTGFDGIWLTEHNFTGESVYCDPIPFASVVAARTSRIRLGFAVIQLALRHPARHRGRRRAKWIPARAAACRAAVAGCHPWSAPPRDLHGQ